MNMYINKNNISYNFIFLSFLWSNKPTISPILFLANSILIPPLSEERRTKPCSLVMASAAKRTSCNITMVKKIWKQGHEKWVFEDISMFKQVQLHNMS